MFLRTAWRLRARRRLHLTFLPTAGRLLTGCGRRLHLTFLRTARRLRARRRLHLTFLRTARRLRTRWRLHLTFLPTARRLLTGCGWRLHLTLLSTTRRLRTRWWLRRLPPLLLLFFPLARPLRRLLLVLLFALWRRLCHDRRLVERVGVDGPPHHGRQHRPYQKARFDRIPF
jgi:hypothetical protein